MRFHTESRGYALRGILWTGGDATEKPSAAVVVGVDGAVAATGPGLEIAQDLRVIDVGWIGPAIVDAHVHMGFGSFARQRARGVVAVRDLGAPPGLIQQWRSDAAREVNAPPVHLATVGPLLTAPGGYPSRTWGADGYAAFVARPDDADAAVAARVAEGVDLIKIALEPSGRAPVPSLETTRAIVRAAHDAGLRVTAHALTKDMVTLALDANVDELCHTPVDALTDRQLQRIVEARVVVCSTLQTFWSGNSADGARASANAARLISAGVPLTYGTDLGNAGTRDGVDSRELQRLADAGMGVQGALRAATEGAAFAPGIDGRAGSGRIVVGEHARMIGLPSSPLSGPDPWAAWEVLPIVALGQWLSA